VADRFVLVEAKAKLADYEISRRQNTRLKICASERLCERLIPLVSKLSPSKVFYESERPKKKGLDRKSVPSLHRTGLIVCFPAIFSKGMLFVEVTSGGKTATLHLVVRKKGPAYVSYSNPCPMR